MIIFPLLRLLLLLLLFQCGRCMSAAQPQNDGGGSSFDTSATDTNQSVSIILFMGVGAFFFSGLLLVAFRRQLAACFGISLNGGGGGGGGVGSRGPQGLSREVIDAFPTYLYEEVNKLHGLMDRELECAICLNEFQPHQALRLLPECSHIFHPECIDPWLLSQATCPVCRSTIREPSGSTSDASEDDHNHVLLMDPLPSVKTPIRQDLEHGSPSQLEYLTVLEIGTTQVVPATLAKSHSTGHGHAVFLMARRCELASPLYSRNRAGLSEGAKVPWRGRMELSGDQERLDLGNLNKNPMGSPLSDSGVCYT